MKEDFVWLAPAFLLICCLAIILFESKASQIINELKKINKNLGEK